ncbi:hypothetical protein FSP39_001349 [Pinctada imbricata]|uniref:F-box/LRR-repeat protein 15-like leucin rich repeat domain-containing protein n=1 Tax=Pinctada imbricata TaxID=66713 RepID=A0AA88XH43_PINIB|nr:hypothetical protein FSP39_001349 [Pinctada imbricata]
MRFLNVSDRKEASLVCRTWYEASLDPILQRDIVIHFHGLSTHDQAPKLTRRKMPHLMLDQFDNSLNAKSVVLRSCKELSENLKSLSLKGSNITESTFVEILSHCTSLTSLDLSCCNSLFLSGKLLEMNSDMQTLKVSLKNVTSLNLSSIRHLSDSVFNRIVTVCTNLEKMSLSSSHITFHTEAYLPRGKTRCASSSLLTFRNILDFIRLQSSKLISLDFSRNPLDDDALEALVSCDDLFLEELILYNCKEIEDVSIIALAHKQKSLKILDIRECVNLTDAGVGAIAANLLKLETLKLSKCRQVTGLAVKKFSLLSRLQVLDMSDMYQLMSSSAQEGLCKNVKMPLTYLNLSCCSLLTDVFVEALCKTHPHLVHLDLGSCNQISNLSVHEISKSLKYLQFLRLAWCKKITDLGILGFEGTAIPEIKHDHDEGGNCRCTRNYSSTTIFRKPTKKVEKKDSGNTNTNQKDDSPRYKLNNLTKLRDLDLAVCSNLTTIGLRQVLKFKELRSLNLNLVPVDDATVMSLTSHNPSLEQLVLAKCSNITDDAVEAIAKRLPRLVSLDISSCDKLTNRSMDFIMTYCKRLRMLDVSFCSNISPSSVDMAETAMRTLQSVHKRLVGGQP